MSALRAHRIATLLAVALALAWPSTARGAASGRTVLALIITNNRGAGLERPDLHYADDDGAKYYELFRTIAGEDGTFLLTEFDSDTARLYPELRASPPDRIHLDAAARVIATRAREALSTGRIVDFYFVFAGHGDIDQGQGFLALTDGRLTGDDLEALLRSIPSTRSHVVLDSCNSFFVLGARKPGGAHFATSEDATRALVERLPNVGVFLSTSADGKVFEWSELQSGIFSHVVRSGLSGAADANGDGVISYAELRAFVDIAASAVKNPAYRPHVFARAPGGRDADALFEMDGHATASLDLPPDPELRLTVRDADDVACVDVHKEAGVAMSLHLPRRCTARAVVDERQVTLAGSRVVARRALDVKDDAPPATFDALAFAGPPPDARGGDDMFRMLFALPFGPRTFADYQARQPGTREEVFGISEEDRERMRVLLEQVAREERARRLQEAASYFGLALLGGAFTGAAFYQRAAGAGYLLLGFDVYYAGLGLDDVLRTSRGEWIYERYSWGLQQSPDEFARVVSRTEESLFREADHYRKQRQWQRWGGGISLAIAAPLFVYAVAESRTFDLASPGMLIWTALTTVAGSELVSSFVPYPTERLAEIWREDPARHDSPRLIIAPTAGGASLALRAIF
jgi:hypothetical protein